MFEPAPKTDFDPTEALAILDEIAALKNRYSGLTYRSADADEDVRSMLDSMATGGDLLDVIEDGDNAMLALYATGQTHSLFGADANYAQAAWECFNDEVQDGASDLGIKKPWCFDHYEYVEDCAPEHVGEDA